MDIKLTKLEKEDPRPKRTYDITDYHRLHTTGINTDHPHYYVSYLDGVWHEINKEVFDAYDEFELEFQSQDKDDKRHLSESSLSDENTFNKTDVKVQSVEDSYFEKEKIKERNTMYTKVNNAVKSLSEKPRRRIRMKFYENQSIRAIAKNEKVNFNAARKSIMAAEEKLKELLEK